MKHKSHPITMRKKEDGPIVIKSPKFTGVGARALINKTGGGAHGIKRRPKKRIRASTNYVAERQNLTVAKDVERKDPLSRFNNWREDHILQEGRVTAYLDPDSNILYYPHQEFRGKGVAVVKVREVEINNDNWHAFASVWAKKSKDLGRKIAAKVGITWENWKEHGRNAAEVRTLKLLFGEA
ncbi:MAG: hypothetical protein ABID38_02010 [Candidatus Diapherotrites archaeon]